MPRELDKVVGGAPFGDGCDGDLGFLLWFNNFTLRHLPKWVADAATAVHFYEAVLATFSILLWHF